MLRDKQQEGKDGWYMKPSQLAITSEVTDIRREPTATTLLNKSMESVITL